MNPAIPVITINGNSHGPDVINTHAVSQSKNYFRFAIPEMMLSPIPDTVKSFQMRVFVTKRVRSNSTYYDRNFPVTTRILKVPFGASNVIVPSIIFTLSVSPMLDSMKCVIGFIFYGQTFSLINKRFELIVDVAKMPLVDPYADKSLIYATKDATLPSLVKACHMLMSKMRILVDNSNGVYTVFPEMRAMSIHNSYAVVFYLLSDDLVLHKVKVKLNPNFIAPLDKSPITSPFGHTGGNGMGFIEEKIASSCESIMDRLDDLKKIPEPSFVYKYHMIAVHLDFYRRIINFTISSVGNSDLTLQKAVSPEKPRPQPLPLPEPEPKPVILPPPPPLPKLKKLPTSVPLPELPPLPALPEFRLPPCMPQPPEPVKRMKYNGDDGLLEFDGFDNKGFLEMFT